MEDGFSFRPNCAVASVRKRNAKIWSQRCCQGLTYHHKKITKIRFRVRLGHFQNVSFPSEWGGGGLTCEGSSWEDCGLWASWQRPQNLRAHAQKLDCAHALAISGIAELTLRAPRMLPSTSGYSSPRYSYKTTPKWPMSFSCKPSNQNTRLMLSLPSRKGQDNYTTQTHQQNRRPYNTRTLLHVNVILKGGN